MSLCSVLRFAQQFEMKWGLWTSSQAGLVTCLEPDKKRHVGPTKAKGISGHDVVIRICSNAYIGQPINVLEQHIADS